MLCKINDIYLDYDEIIAICPTPTREQSVIYVRGGMEFISTGTPREIMDAIHSQLNPEPVSIPAMPSA